jgi:hypothetical protein
MASFGSPASLKSRLKPRDLRELKKIGWEDLSDKSLRRTNRRQSVGEYVEKERERMGRSVTDRIVKIEKLFLPIFAILAA